MSKFYYLNQVDSTNDFALALGEMSAESGTVVIAHRQTRGRGRRGNSWHSPEGGLYLSLLLRTKKKPEQLAGAQLIAALSVVLTLKKALKVPVKIQLPNDLFLNGKKLGGILVETKIRGEKLDFMVVGIGINLNLSKADFPLDLRDFATSIKLETEQEISAAQLIPPLLAELSQNFQLFFSAGLKQFLPQIKAECLTLGKKVRIKFLSGELEGEVLDLSNSGNLILKNDRGEIREIPAFEELRMIS